MSEGCIPAPSASEASDFVDIQKSPWCKKIGLLREKLPVRGDDMNTVKWLISRARKALRNISVVVE